MSTRKLTKIIRPNKVSVSAPVVAPPVEVTQQVETSVEVTPQVETSVEVTPPVSTSVEVTPPVETSVEITPPVATPDEVEPDEVEPVATPDEVEPVETPDEVEPDEVEPVETPDEVLPVVTPVAVNQPKTTDVRFMAFTEKIKSLIQFDDDTLNILRSALNQVYGTTAPIVPINTSGKKKTSWNCYVTQQMTLLKGHKKSGGEMFKEIGASWKLLTPEQKSAYGETAVVTDVAPQKKRYTGYNLYVKENMPLLKGEISDGTDRMKRVARDWKLLGADVKKTWSERAKLL
jgi:hypothetical protein